MKLDIQVIPQSEIVNNDFDYYDWWGNTLYVRIADMGDTLRTRLILIHALVEELTTQMRGITADEITRYDATAIESFEAGNDIDCPYRDQHLLALSVEYIILSFLGISKEGYEKSLKQFFESNQKESLPKGISHDMIPGELL